MMNTKIQANSLALIETMRLNKQGQVLLLPLHLQRLKYSAQQLGFDYDESAVVAALMPYLHQHYAITQRLRLSLDTNQNIEVQCTKLSTTAQPVCLHIQALPPVAATQELLHKTTARSHWQAGEDWLQTNPNYFDVIYTNTDGLVTEGGRSNIYIWQQNRWITPPVELGLLAGVQRQELINKGWVAIQPFSRSELLQAPRIRISNALRGWLDAKISPSF